MKQVKIKLLPGRPREQTAPTERKKRWLYLCKKMHKLWSQDGRGGTKMNEVMIIGPANKINWLMVAAFRYAVNRHTTQAMYGVGDVILDNLDVLHTEFIKQFIREIEREQYVTELDQERNKRYEIDFFSRLKTHIKDYQRYLKDEKGTKQQELYKLLCKVMELIPQADMSHKWPAWEWRIDDTTYLTPMLNRLKDELKKRKGDKNV